MKERLGNNRRTACDLMAQTGFKNGLKQVMHAHCFHTVKTSFAVNDQSEIQQASHSDPGGLAYHIDAY